MNTHGRMKRKYGRKEGGMTVRKALRRLGGRVHRARHIKQLKITPWVFFQ